MPVNLGQFVRPRTVSIFARNPAVYGQLVTFILTDIAIPVPFRVRLDLTKSIGVTRAATTSRSPVEPLVIDNIRLQPEVVTVQGQLSATPLGLVASRLGGFSQMIRRDLRELDKLRLIQQTGEPVILVTPMRVYPSMAMSINEAHGDGDKVELALTFEEIEILTPLAVAGTLDLETALQGSVGANATTNAGAQGTTTVTAPADLAGGLGG